MSPRRLRAFVVLLPALAFTGCSYVHLGRTPLAIIGDARLAQAYGDLRTEQKVVRQQLALARRENDALRAALETNTADATTPELAVRLRATTRELATLRTQLQAARAPASSAPISEPAPRPDPAALAEISRLRVELAQVSAENAALNARVTTLASQNQAAQTALVQLRAERLTGKMPRAEAPEPSVLRAPAPAALVAEISPPAPIPPEPPSASVATAEFRAAAFPAPPAAPAATANSAPGPTPAARTHIVAKGETLETIANKYFGNPSQWRLLYQTNQEKFRSGHPLEVGMQLTIPEM